MLPEDISLVRDDLGAKDTRLDELFRKNTVLPQKTKRTVEVAKTIVKDSNDEIRIVVVEGPSNRHSSTNKAIGDLSISGNQLSRDLIKGTEIDLTCEMSESRDLTVSAYLNGTGQEFSHVFKQSERNVSSRLLACEILLLETKIREEIEDAEKNGNRNTAVSLETVLTNVETLMGDAASLKEDDVTDKKFQLDDTKRRLAQDMFELTSGKRLDQARLAYEEARAEVSQLVRESGNDRERHVLQEVVAREQAFINSTNPVRIQGATTELERLRWKILLRTPGFLVGMFKHLVDRRASMNDEVQCKQLIENGKRAVEKEAWDELRQINDRLWDLLPAKEQASEEMRIYTGIV
jgi:molecular chaperone DnaK